MALTIGKEAFNVGELETVELNWTADITADSGSSSDETAAIHGTIEGVSFTPSVVTGEVPTNLYDVVLTDVAGKDVLGGKGANLSDTASSSAGTNPTSTPVFPIPVMGILTLAVTNAGLGAKGVVRVHFRR